MPRGARPVKTLTAFLLLGLILGPMAIAKVEHRSPGQVCTHEYWREASGAIAHETICRKGGRYENRSHEKN